MFGRMSEREDDVSEKQGKKCTGKGRKQVKKRKSKKMAGGGRKGR